ncbi:SAYSvFN domain-containing protein 1 [Hyposmocoma kahamanoa]|uniref:SAYSvFN domain-containing protein 1 n=1 Tax=Hyposmocoma kahamanoa TaxID=1477025 RepID=UPI000E6DA2F2|nr:SAYSvFN domain-containing protein 1 [Hyposmocoma kahamanoa]
MEAKLREYRARRRRQELVENTKEKLETTKKTLADILLPKLFNKMNKEKKDEEVYLLDEEEKPPPKFIPLQTEDPAEVASDASELESVAEETQESWRYFIVKWSLYTIIWITLFAFFLNVGFGAVFFVISALVFICINTRTKRKKPGEISAYSVFNEDCKSIDGTLNAEELQRQMMFGMGGLRLV